MLRHLCLPSAGLRGRKYPEAPHPYRNDFQRDRDRIIHSRAFRRLQGKTQVFAVSSGDHFRNRLTHTIEVAQIARTVANTLQLNEEFTETLALAHDLGHPPFAHVAEREIHRQMQAFGESFEHNRHALRVVDLLEQRYPRFDGLNLTFEVREGIVKHSREIDAGQEPDLQEFLPGERPPLEAQLLDLADEIAYNTADLDDAFDQQVFSSATIREHVPLFDELSEQVDTQFPGASDRIRFSEIQRQLINILVGGLIEGTVHACEEAHVRTVEDVRAFPGRLARMTERAAVLSRQLRSLLTEELYSSPALLEQRKLTTARVARLFAFLLEHPQHVSPGYREHLDDTPAFRVVCDYVAGMTDGYFLRTYQALLGS